MEGDVSYKLQGVSTGYRVSGESIVIQRDINACLRQGEFTCLLGPNGATPHTCGLSTTSVGRYPDWGQEYPRYHCLGVGTTGEHRADGATIGVVDDGASAGGVGTQSIYRLLG